MDVDVKDIRRSIPDYTYLLKVLGVYYIGFISASTLNVRGVSRGPQMNVESRGLVVSHH